LPPAFKELLRATKEPFVQAIMDLACPQLVFNRTILMGDASFVDPATHGVKHLEGHCERGSRLWENLPESRNYPSRSIIGSGRS
jgi:hypothetical protein